MAEVSQGELATLIATLQSTNTQLGQIIKAINTLQEALVPGSPYDAVLGRTAPPPHPPETPARGG